ncbi:acylphosphatase [Endozoicomonas sp. SM1973]|uniref:Acylphosphatase n=1 Tax=Spartinivicinus marinus TaxID=2994442 RepID=A0A853I8H2_9GAMM|nr:acylphosphatase [Spartinivicinus marinus]MCX4028716.1 acylphosphatase [Spartinivicinus marinus]NYZ68022.1 acylphosphatase [Spartinivicinus marinus]
MGKVYKKAWVSGKVQGVWFRASTKQQADQLGISGYAKNLEDGRVEVFMCGNEVSVAKLLEWLEEGPPMAVVNELKVADAESEASEGFVTC